MRPLFRNAVAIAASASIVFFWSCERHEVGELPDHQHHGKDDHSKGTTHSKAGHHDDHKHDDKAGHADDKPNPADGGAAQEGTGTPAPGQGQHKHDAQHAASPAGTAAQFFPSPTP